MAEYVLEEIAKRNNLLRAKNGQEFVKSNDRLPPAKETIIFEYLF